MSRRERRVSAEISLVLQLLAFVEEADDLVVLRDLERALQRVRVGQLGAGEIFDAEDRLVLIVETEAVEEPRLLLDDRTAEVEVDVVVTVDGVAALQRVAHVVAVLVA